MLHIDSKTGLIRDARQEPSPNCDDRPESCAPDLIVVHGISLPPGEFGGPWIDRFFTNRLDANAHPYFQTIADLRVSAHLLIRRDGELVQYVSLNKRAWHAGDSCYENRNQCNDFSIGIELEGMDTIAYTDEQYDVLCRAIASIRSAIDSLKLAPIVGHCDIAPGRKTDPGPAFDWNRVRKRLALTTST
jgi:AmpD protein